MPQPPAGDVPAADLSHSGLRMHLRRKCSIIYDTGGRRYGIETTNHAECYNMVIRHIRGFPLVGIVEFIIYGCTRYFRDQYQAAAVLLNDPGVIFCNRVTNYMKEKIENAHYHRVVSMGTKDQKFEVLCKDIVTP